MADWAGATAAACASARRVHACALVLDFLSAPLDLGSEPSQLPTEPPLLKSRATAPSESLSEFSGGLGMVQLYNPFA